MREGSTFTGYYEWYGTHRPWTICSCQETWSEAPMRSNPHTWAKELRRSPWAREIGHHWCDCWDSYSARLRLLGGILCQVDLLIQPYGVGVSDLAYITVTDLYIYRSIDKCKVHFKFLCSSMHIHADIFIVNFINSNWFWHGFRAAVIGHKTCFVASPTIATTHCEGSALDRIKCALLGRLNDSYTR